MMTEKHAWIWPVLLTATIFTLSGTSNIAVPSVETAFIPKDKLAHFLVFGLLATAILRVPYLRERGWRGVIIAIILTSLYGAFDEWRQSFTPGRFVEFADWVANTLGAIVAATLYHLLHPYRQLLEFKVSRKSKRG